MVEEKTRVLSALAKCIQQGEKKGMASFWLTFKEKPAFESLINVLELNEEEKISWWVSFEHQQSNANNLIERIRWNTHHYFKGASINMDVLKEKGDKAAGVLFHFMFSETLTEIDKGLKVKHLLNYHEKEGLLVIQHKLEAFQNILSIPLPSAFNHDAMLRQTQSLERAVEQIHNNDVLHQNHLRQLLNKLNHGLTELNERLKNNVKHTFLFMNGIHQLTAFIKENALLLTNTAVQNGLRVCEQVKAEWYESLPVLMTENRQPSMKLLEESTLRHAKQIEALQNMIQHSLKRLEEKGHAIRQEALLDLSCFIQNRRGVWETIFRLISPSYRHCMVQLACILKNQNVGSLAKTDEIIKTIETAKKTGVCFIQYRLNALYQAGSMMFFEPRSAGRQLAPIVEASMLRDSRIRTV